VPDGCGNRRTDIHLGEARYLVTDDEAAHVIHQHDQRVSPAIQLINLRKRFGDVVAVDGVSLSIAQGEFFSLLGPSGSGKTTVLRMIAGFELPTSGTVLLDGDDVSRSAPYDRDVNTVFQDYALFPHMSVLQNIEFGLRVKRVKAAERTRRAVEMLEAVRLGQMAHRRPHQLSGGQRQRVALARALVNRPKVLLLDEPLGALDLKLREEMQVELKTIQRDVGITFVFVTHDQGEALSMSNRIAVFNHGRIEQVGTPSEMYQRPISEFVAGFVGTTNLLDAQRSERLLGRRQPHSIRPEAIRLVPPGTAAPGADVQLEGTVSDVQYMGAEGRVRVDLADGTRLIVSVPGDGLADMVVGAAARLAWPRASALPVATEEVGAEGAHQPTS
jgi:putative spermidine/putrescine transport system ATP-binding protein